MQRAEQVKLGYRRLRQPVAEHKSYEPMDPIAELSRLFLFRNWPREDLSQLLREGRFTNHRQGDVLFEAGESCDQLLVLEAGRVQLFRVAPDGRAIPLHLVNGPALIACAALFLDQCFPASARVVSREARLFRYPGDSFLKMLERRPDLSRRMIAALATRIGELADRLEAGLSQAARTRVARWLSEQPTSRQQDGKRVIVLSEPKKVIANTLSMTPETFSRELAHLRQEGIIEVHGRTIVLADPARLLEI